MLDTIWTLSHNNGPIFNKGDLFWALFTQSYPYLRRAAVGANPRGGALRRQVAAYGPVDAGQQDGRVAQAVPRQARSLCRLGDGRGARFVHKYPSEKKAPVR